MNLWSWVGARLVALTLVGMLASCGGGGGGGGAPLDPPAISTQPLAAVVNDGDTASFSVGATGGNPLTYQWQKNGVAIAGAVSASYVTAVLTLADANAQYRVVVSNPAGSVTSPVATVTVNPVVPRINVQPLAAQVGDGSQAAFSVHATGSEPKTYQWMRNGVAVPGANASSIVISPVSLADTGVTFSVRVSNVAGSVTSDSAILTVTPVAAHITTAPLAITVADGANASFAVVASGSGTLAYQWRANGVDIAGATAPTLSFATTAADGGKLISVAVSNALGTDTSAPVLLTVDALAPTIVAGPQDATVQTGGAATFAVTAAGSILAYQWQRSDDGGITWAPIPGATAAAFSIPSATLGWADTRLRVQVTNAAGSATSPAATLRVTPNVHLIAGIAGGTGYADGIGSQARFNGASATAIDANGNIFVADRVNAVIRKVTPAGVVSTVAGQFGVRTNLDGPAATAAFISPQALAIDGGGNLYVGDSWVIRKITLGGVVSTLAGNAPGSADGSGGAASFRDVRSIVSDAAGNLVVVDAGANQTLRKVSSSGVVTTLAGSAGNFGSTDGQGAAARFTDMSVVAVDGNGDFFVADNQSVRRVTANGAVSLFAGTPGVFGSNDGPRLSAHFISLTGLVFDGAGNLYIGESFHIRRIEPSGNTITLAGGGFVVSPGGGDVDGLGGAAYVASPSGLGLTPDGSHIVFTAPFNGTLRSTTLAGDVTTLAGLSPQNSSVDGPASIARFFLVNAIASDAQGNVYMPEGVTQSIRKIDPSGTVSTTKFTNVLWSNLSAIALDPGGAIYLADFINLQIGRMAPDGTVTVLAGVASTSGHNDGPGNQATFSYPQGLAVDAAGNVFVSDAANSIIRKIDKAGVVTTVAGQAGQCGHKDGSSAVSLLCFPTGMSFDAQGRLYIADSVSHVIRRLETDGSLTTFAGGPFSAGYGDGLVARFNNPTALALDGDGNLFVADASNGLVRRVTPQGFTSTVIGNLRTQALHPGPGGDINGPIGITVLTSGRVVISSELAIVGD